ncbi:hypothetical protein BGZ65_001155 [Modicella reniformis]|uniref:Uncharacterized protein n=1 Tax=Modicella reniformis TaxID=1440133 RepID=A0A9P6MJ42_9FUNG|nr:hypothetical protein BGZ65_001155 [Modicella reniformis]
MLTRRPRPVVLSIEIMERVSKQFEKIPLVLGFPQSMMKRTKRRRHHRAYVKETPEAQALADEELGILIGAEFPVPLIQKYGEATGQHKLCASPPKLSTSEGVKHAALTTVRVYWIGMWQVKTPHSIDNIDLLYT